MDKLNIYLADGKYDGAIIMNSTSSKFSVARIKREEIADFDIALDEPGVYFLLIGDDSVYVGQSGLDTVRKLVLNTHSGSIDADWHTVVGFMCMDKAISSNELLFIENAMCEYAHQNFTKCLTVTPAKANCNAKYRKEHYKLNNGQVHTCNQYIEDIKYYLSKFPYSIFPGSSDKTVAGGEKALFCYRSEKRDIDAKATILIHCGHSNKRKTILKAGSKVSNVVSDKYSAVEEYRKELESEGILVNRILQEDLPFDSQSGAGQFIYGSSFDGNSNWKRVSDNKPLKELL